MIKYGFILLLIGCLFKMEAQTTKNLVSENEMQRVYNEVKTPYKYGLVLVPVNNSQKVDCPSIFRDHQTWYMTYIVFDGRGYETRLAQSKNLLDWKDLGTIMSFSKDTLHWDSNQKAGYIALQDPNWGGTYQWNGYSGKHWMTYLGGSKKGYEAGILAVGVAYTNNDPVKIHEWERLEFPVLKSKDKDVRWWENATIFKSTVIQDSKKNTGHEFVMYYNAAGDSATQEHAAERIGMAVSDDMIHWQRYLTDPVLNHHMGITGDAFLQKMDNLWVMFYFGAFWPKGRKEAFDRFACSYDLVHWTDWAGDDLIKPSEPYDEIYAHKPCVIKWKGIVYHFYCAVNKKDQRGIAVATSIDLGKSGLTFKNKQ